MTPCYQNHYLPSKIRTVTLALLLSRQSVLFELLKIQSLSQTRGCGIYWRAGGPRDGWQHILAGNTEALVLLVKFDRMLPVSILAC